MDFKLQLKFIALFFFTLSAWVCIEFLEITKQYRLTKVDQISKLIIQRVIR